MAHRDEPPDDISWEEDFCPECKNPYAQEAMVALENGEDPGKDYPYCSAACAKKASDLAVERDKAWCDAMVREEKEDADAIFAARQRQWDLEGSYP